MKTLIRTASLGIALIALTLAVAGCGEKKDQLTPGSPEKFTLMLDFFPNADHAGIYAAQAGGHFEEEGLDVEIRQPSDPAAPLKLLAAGSGPRGLVRARGAPRARQGRAGGGGRRARARAADVDRVAAERRHRDRPRTCAGKTVGTAGIDYQSAYLRRCSTRRTGTRKVEERNVGFEFGPALVTGKVDAMLGAFWNYEGVQLERSRTPRSSGSSRPACPRTTSS